MIDYKQSAELNNMMVDELKSWFKIHPKSHKKVVRICEGNECNDVNEVEFRQVTNLCKKCALNIPEVIDANRLRGIERCSDPEWKITQSKQMKQYHIDHPEFAKIISEKAIERYKDLGYLKRMSEIGIKCWEDQAKRDKQSEIMKNSKLHQRQIGGQDIIMHHYLYDDANLSKYTMPMTRSEHMVMHNRMRMDGYEVPHINSETDDNGLWRDGIIIMEMIYNG